MKAISAIIPSYNSHRTVMRTIDSLLSQPATYVPEIIVVDSSDDAKTPDLLAGCRSERIRVIRLDRKTMPAIGRNIGAAAATREVLAFIDSDAYAAEDWAERILASVESGCHVGGGSILLPPEQTSHPIALAQYFLQFNEFTGSSRKRIVDFAPSCNLFCEKAFFERVGGFPEIRASEDVLFGFKANRDAPFFFEPAIRVFHIFLLDRERLLSNQRLLGAYVLHYRRRQFRRWYYRGVWPAFFLPGFLLVKFARISARILGGGPLWMKRSFFISLPYFLLGFMAWAEGFWQAVFEAEGGSVA